MSCFKLFFNIPAHGDPGSWCDLLDQDQQLVSDASYALGETIPTHSWETDPIPQLDTKLLKRSDNEGFDCSNTNTNSSEQPAARSHSRELAEAPVLPSPPKLGTKKRGRLSDSTKIK